MILNVRRRICQSCTAGVLLLLNLLFSAGSARAQKLITPGYQFNSDPTCRELFLIAHGQGGDAQGRLFNLAWFTFTRQLARTVWCTDQPLSRRIPIGVPAGAPL